MQDADQRSIPTQEKANLRQAVQWIAFGWQPTTDAYEQILGYPRSIQSAEYRDFPAYHALDKAKRELFRALHEGRLKAYGWGDEIFKLIEVPTDCWDSMDRINWEQSSVKSAPRLELSKANRGDAGASKSQVVEDSYDGVELRTPDLVIVFPQPVMQKTKAESHSVPARVIEDGKTDGRRGRRPYDWESFYAAIVVMADLDNLPEIQADLEKHMLQWCSEHWGKEVGGTTVRDKVRKIYQMKRAGREAFKLMADK